MPNLDALLRGGLEDLELCYPDHQIDVLLQFIAELQRWNRAYNLTAVRDEAQMVDRHLLDCLAIAPFVAQGPVLDVGAGAGLPGIPLAIVQPQRRFVLLDSNGKKTRFMGHAARTLALHNVDIVQSRVEQYRPPELPATIVARAFSAVEALLTLVEPLCQPGTQILAMRGRDQPFFLPAGFKQLENRTLKVPRSPAPRHLLILERE